MKKDIDTFRKGYLAIGEFLDAWRIIPRLIVAGYGFLTYSVFVWYMSLEPSIIEGCDVAVFGETCINDAPNAMHTAALTAVGAFATAIFAFYSAAGRKWDNGIKLWGGSDNERTASSVEENKEHHECDCSCHKKSSSALE